MKNVIGYRSDGSPVFFFTPRDIPDPFTSTGPLDLNPDKNIVMTPQTIATSRQLLKERGQGWAWTDAVLERDALNEYRVKNSPHYADSLRVSKKPPRHKL